MQINKIIVPENKHRSSESDQCDGVTRFFLKNLASLDK